MLQIEFVNDEQLAHIFLQHFLILILQFLKNQNNLLLNLYALDDEFEKSQ
jgi:hypothetical protein